MKATNFSPQALRLVSKMQVLISGDVLGGDGVGGGRASITDVGGLVRCMCASA